MQTSVLYSVRSCSRFSIIKPKGRTATERDLPKNCSRLVGSEAVRRVFSLHYFYSSL